VPRQSLIKRLTQQEQINFLLTNRIPRRYATLFMGWFSRIEIPLIRDITLYLWKLFADELNLAEAKKTRFTSLHDCFIRELKQGARSVDQDPRIITSPCDAIVGAHGKIDGIECIQAKGFPYSLMELLADETLVERYRDGMYVTLRLQSTMYHRFHAPADCQVSAVNYISGDTWNVNPIALKRVERLYCKNERAVIDCQLTGSEASLTLVPVAAILVASIQLNFLDEVLDLKYKGPNRISCAATFSKGQEMGYFQHGSTIIVFASRDFTLVPNITEGAIVRMGQPLLQYP
jgi:phosphatidylserine decarboxylase